MKESEFKEICEKYDVPRFNVIFIRCKECKFKSLRRSKCIKHVRLTEHELTPLKEEAYNNKQQNFAEVDSE